MRRRSVELLQQTEVRLGLFQYLFGPGVSDSVCRAPRKRIHERCHIAKGRHSTSCGGHKPTVNLTDTLYTPPLSHSREPDLPSSRRKGKRRASNRSAGPRTDAEALTGRAPTWGSLPAALAALLTPCTQNGMTKCAREAIMRASCMSFCDIGTVDKSHQEMNERKPSHAPSLITKADSSS